MNAITYKFIIIPNPSKKQWYFFIFLLGSLLRNIIPALIVDNYDKDNSKKKGRALLKALLSKLYIEIIGNIFTALTMGFPHFYYRIINTKEYNKRTQEFKNIINQHKQLINFSKYEANTNQIMIMIVFIISFVDVFCQTLVPIKYLIEYMLNKDTFGYKDPVPLYMPLFFDIFARYFFSRYILKTYFYSHHKLSFLINFIGIILLSIVDIQIKLGICGSFYIGIIFFKEIMYSFEDIMNKFAFLHVVLLPCSLIFYNGCFQLVFFIIITFLFFICEMSDDRYINADYLFKHLLAFTPCDIMRNLFLMKVIDRFSAQHMAFLRVTETVFLFIYTLIVEGKIIPGIENNNENNKIEFKIFYILGFTFLLIGSIIYNELIIINTPILKAKTDYYLDKDVDIERTSSIEEGSLSDSKIYDKNLMEDLTGSDM